MQYVFFHCRGQKKGTKVPNHENVKFSRSLTTQMQYNTFYLRNLKDVFFGISFSNILLLYWRSVPLYSPILYGNSSWGGHVYVRVYILKAVNSLRSSVDASGGVGKVFLFTLLFPSSSVRPAMAVQSCRPPCVEICLAPSRRKANSWIY
jgi:hypothetical protein